MADNDARGRIALDGVEFAFATTEQTILRDLSFAVAHGEIFVLLGPSGCGKSTVLNLIAGFEAPTRGTVATGGTVVAGPGRDRVVIFQDSDSLYGWLSVVENVEFPLRVTGVAADERRNRALAALTLVGLRGHEHKYPNQLSGGMKQRTQLARALVLESPILLMDEPFAALDALTRRRMQDELLQLWEDTRFTVLFVTHSIPEAVRIGNRILLLSAHPGQVRAELSSDGTDPVGADGLRLSERIQRMLFSSQALETEAPNV